MSANQARANVPTAAASRYLQQLCKHWSHKFPVSFSPTHGEIGLPAGNCVLDADEAGLRIVLVATEAADLTRLKEVVAEHIQRFAFRETLAFDWTSEEASA